MSPLEERLPLILTNERSCCSFLSSYSSRTRATRVVAALGTIIILGGNYFAIETLREEPITNFYSIASLTFFILETVTFTVGGISLFKYYRFRKKNSDQAHLDNYQGTFFDTAYYIGIHKDLKDKKNWLPIVKKSLSIMDPKLINYLCEKKSFKDLDELALSMVSVLPEGLCYGLCMDHFFKSQKNISQDDGLKVERAVYYQLVQHLIVDLCETGVEGKAFLIKAINPDLDSDKINKNSKIFSKDYLFFQLLGFKKDFPFHKSEHIKINSLNKEGLKYFFNIQANVFSFERKHVFPPLDSPDFSGIISLIEEKRSGHALFFECKEGQYSLFDSGAIPAGRYGSFNEDGFFDFLLKHVQKSRYVTDGFMSFCFITLPQTY